MKKSGWAFIFILMCSCLFSEKLAVLPEVLNPESIAVGGDQLYISDQSTVLLYSLKDFKLIKKIGRQGQGPGEFKHSPRIAVFPDHLVANCFGKVLFFSRDGNFIKERNTGLISYVYPVGDNFVGITLRRDPATKDNFKVISLHNKKMEHIRDITKSLSKTSKRKPSGRTEREAFRDFFRHRVNKDRIFVADTSKGFHIEVFDSGGHKLYSIDKKNEKVKITEEDKKEFIDEMKNSRDVFDRMMVPRSKFVFKKYYPAFYNFRVRNDKIYVFTYQKKNNKKEIIVLDLKGKILEKSYLDFGGSYLYSISNDRLFYLKENEGSEKWELFAEEI